MEEGLGAAGVVGVVGVVLGAMGLCLFAGVVGAEEGDVLEMVELFSNL